MIGRDRCKDVVDQMATFGSSKIRWGEEAETRKDNQLVCNLMLNRNLFLHLNVLHLESPFGLHLLVFPIAFTSW